MHPHLFDSEGHELKGLGKKKAQFLVDENVCPEVAPFLEHYGYKSVCVSRVGLSGCSDWSVFVYAQRHNRVILTHDRDFLDNRRFPINQTPGVVVLPGGQNVSRLGPALCDVLDDVAPYARNCVHTKILVSESRVWTIMFYLKKQNEVCKRRVQLLPHGRIRVLNDMVE